MVHLSYIYCITILIMHSPSNLPQDGIPFYTNIAPKTSSYPNPIFLEIVSQRSAVRWGANLIYQLWNIFYLLCSNINNALQENSYIHIPSDLNRLTSAIQTEYWVRILDLPQVYIQYFSIHLLVLLLKFLSCLKKWFLDIRSSREFLHLGLYNDEWQYVKTLKRWISLLPRSPIWLYFNISLHTYIS